jgi:signal transduction histidine kinase
VGLPPRAGRKTGMGLTNMKARARMIGASLQIRAGESGGTEVTCLLRSPKPQTGSGQEAYAP